MTWVKICGLTNKDDVAAVVAAGADAVGFVNVAGSPRFVDQETAAQLGRHVPIHTILLTLDIEPEEAVWVLEQTGLSGIQAYGEHAIDTVRVVSAAGYLALFPQRATPNLQLSAGIGIPLLDTPSETELGGTGRVFDWSITSGIAERFVLAGGLRPDNVVDAIVAAQPWGIDASSGLERSPGTKDHSMVTDFITKAKNT